MAKTKNPKFNSVNDALKYLESKDKQKEIRKEAQRQFNEKKFAQQRATQQLALAQAAANQRNRKMGIMASRAERLELEAVSLDEVPLLHTMERERTRLSTPPDRFIVQTERMATDSFPD